MFMAVSTYLEHEQYKATICPIDCEVQNIQILKSPAFKTLYISGETGVIDLVNKFYNMVTANGHWPTTNEKWSEAQCNNDCWSTILDKFYQPNTCLIRERRSYGLCNERIMHKDHS